MRALADRVPFDYAWVILIAGVFANAVGVGGTFWMMAVYIPAVSDDFGVPRFGVVLAFMFGQSLAAFAGPFVGRYMDLHGARRALLAGSVLVPIALVATAASTEVWQLFVSWGAVSIARSLIFPIPYNWLVTRWFERRRQAALGVVTVGFGLGGAAVLPALAAIESRSGWPAAMVVSAALIFVVHGLAALLIVRDHPSDMGLRPEGASGEAGLSADDEGGFTGSQAMRTMAFWLVATGMMFFFTGQGAVTALAIDFFHSRGVAGGATIVAAGALIRTVARLPLGLSLSRIDRVFALAMIVSASQALAVAVLLASTSATGIVAYTLLWGLGGAFAPMLEPLLVTRAFGVRHFGAVSGAVAVVAFGGQMIGPVGGAALFDALDSYTLPYALYAAGFLVAVVLFAAASLHIGGRAHREQAARVGMGERGQGRAGPS
ncbi:MAG: MFS transporter [Dehalococcoidia bacterium]